MQTQVFYLKNPEAVPCEILLPLSKSESNRVLILNHLSHGRIKAENYSDAKDTQLLQVALKAIRTRTANTCELWCKDAGTVARFLLALCAFESGKFKLYGEKRLHQRPMKALIEAIRQMGTSVECLEKEGFLPVLIQGGGITSNQVALDPSESSQFVSALMLVAPFLPQGLAIRLNAEPVSVSYIHLTAKILKQAGFTTELSKQEVRISAQAFQTVELNIGADWSAAVFFYAYVALSKNSIFLPGLALNSPQGDVVLKRFMTYFGVQSQEDKKGLLIHYQETPFTPKSFSINMINCPDLAPVFLTFCAIQGFSCAIYGLETLAKKESDRTAELAATFSVFGVSFSKKSAYWLLEGKAKNPGSITLSTANDHRLVMAYTLFALVFDTVHLNETGCVEKSFPTFWDELQKIGFNLTHRQINE
jgi:3-phosphoshikimate 1-carboxyvinyltransferase